MRRELGMAIVAIGSAAAAPPPETPTGSNIPGAHTSAPVQQLGNIRQHWTDAAVLRARETSTDGSPVRAMCRQKASESAAIAASSDIPNEQIIHAIPCSRTKIAHLEPSRTSSGFMLMLHGNGFRYALAEALVNAQYRRALDGIATAPPLPHRVHDAAVSHPSSGTKLACGGTAGDRPSAKLWTGAGHLPNNLGNASQEPIR